MQVGALRKVVVFRTLAPDQLHRLAEALEAGRAKRVHQLENFPFELAVDGLMSLSGCGVVPSPTFPFGQVKKMKPGQIVFNQGASLCPASAWKFSTKQHWAFCEAKRARSSTSSIQACWRHVSQLTCHAGFRDNLLAWRSGVHRRPQGAHTWHGRLCR